MKLNKKSLTILLFLTFTIPHSSPCLSQETGQEKVTAPDTTEQNFDSVEERRLYTVLQNERASLVDERKALILKEKELKTLQEEADKKLMLLDRKLKELQKIQYKITELLAKKDAEEVRKTKALSLIYAKMNPDRAALAMANLDEQLAADLLANMKVKSAAKILDRLDKSKASRLSTTFTTIKVE